MRPPTTAPGQHLGFHDRLQALRQDSSSGSSILSASPTPPLPAIAENWEVHSAHSVFSDSASSCGSDTFTDMNSPLPPFDHLDSFTRHSAPELGEVKQLAMDPLDGFAKDPYDEEIATTREMFAPTSALSRSSSYPDPTSAFLSPNSGGSPYDFSVPAFSEYTSRESRRSLLDHFCNVLSHLIVFKEDSGNPFRQLVLPMAQKSPPLLNAIYAISSAHLEHRGLHVEERALDLHSKALQGLANLIAHKDEGNRDEVLAVIILLLYYEVCTSYQCVRGRTNHAVDCPKWFLDSTEQPFERRTVNYARKKGEAWPHECFSRTSIPLFRRCFSTLLRRLPHVRNDPHA